MTHTETIMQAVANSIKRDGKDVFIRREFVSRLGVSRDEWAASSYTAIFKIYAQIDQFSNECQLHDRFNKEV